MALALLKSIGDKSFMPKHYRSNKWSSSRIICKSIVGCLINVPTNFEKLRYLFCWAILFPYCVTKSWAYFFACQGLRLELCTNDRVGLLSDVTRIFREHGLSVSRADVNTRGSKAMNVFYVTDAAGNDADLKVIDAVRREIGQAVLFVKESSTYSGRKSSSSSSSSSPIQGIRSRFSIGNFFGRPSQVLYSLGLNRSFS